MNFFLLLILFSVTSIFSDLLDIKITDEPFDYRFKLPENTYHKYCKNIYSQNGEDGIIEQLIKELDIKNGTFCEFGASDGITSSNTYNLIKNHNFSGISIELDKLLYEKCLDNYRTLSNVKVFHGAVLYNDKNNDLNAWLKRGNLPYDFDLLSIDIDGDDYYVWENLTDYNPKIVIFEVNPYRDPIFDELPKNRCKEYKIDLLSYYSSNRVAGGCSFISGIKLGLNKGYVPVSFTGNITFVRKDLVSKLKEFPYQMSENAYDYLKLYSHLITWWANKWTTNTFLILNVALRDYYLKFQKKSIDLNWLDKRMNQIINNIEVIF